MCVCVRVEGTDGSGSCVEKGVSRDPSMVVPDHHERVSVCRHVNRTRDSLGTRGTFRVLFLFSLNHYHNFPFSVRL